MSVQIFTPQPTGNQLTDSNNQNLRNSIVQIASTTDNLQKQIDTLNTTLADINARLKAHGI